MNLCTQQTRFFPDIIYNTVHPALLVFLQFGQIIHIGKGTSWGLGDMQLDCSRTP